MGSNDLINIVHLLCHEKVFAFSAELPIRHIAYEEGNIRHADLRFEWSKVKSQWRKNDHFQYTKILIRISFKKKDHRQSLLHCSNNRT